MARACGACVIFDWGALASYAARRPGGVRLRGYSNMPLVLEDAPERFERCGPHVDVGAELPLIEDNACYRNIAASAVSDRRTVSNVPTAMNVR